MSSRRITLVADEILGYVRTGGIGTATTSLALALARLGHDVEVLYSSDPPERPLDPRWEQQYACAKVTIRTLPSSEERVEPPYFARMRAVERALRERTPDVAVVQDLAAPAYTALRLRQLGQAFGSTLFVVYCHGTRQWITDMARKVRVLPGALAVSRLEQASVELADVAVSPSEYMLEWMRRQSWRLPDTSIVIPLLTRAGATGEPPPQRARADSEGRVERIAFFGRLEERKGLRPFAAGLNALEPDLLREVELEFLGRATPAWPPDRVEALLSESARSSLARLSFETELDQHEALERLRRSGTLAVMPSHGESFGNTIRECLEHGIPFIASDAGAIPELVDPGDRGRVLFEPTAEGVERALRRALTAPQEALRPARAAFDDAESLERWAEVLALPARRRPPLSSAPAVDAIVSPSASDAPSRCLVALSEQSYSKLQVIPAETREAGLERARGEWVLFLETADEPERELVETLVRAQAASDADVVSCALRLENDEGDEQLHFFAGEPRGLAVLGNGYGQVALIRRSLLGIQLPDGETDPDWPLLARLAARGTRIVSVPIPLVTRCTRPGSIEHDPREGLLVLQELERALPDQLRSLARLAAGLAADQQQRVPAPAEGLPRRAGRRLRHTLGGGMAMTT